MPQYANEVLHPKLQVKPLEEGEIAVYKLNGWGDPDPMKKDTSGKPVPKTPGYSLVGRKRIYDIIAKKTVTIENTVEVKNFKGPSGLNLTKEVPKSVLFRSDKLVYVDHTMPETYAFLERVDENSTNEFRKKGSRAVFHRVDARKKVNQELYKQIFLLDALEWVMRKAKPEDLMSCAEYVNKTLIEGKKIQTSIVGADQATTYQLVKKSLFELAQENPQLVLKGSTDKIAQVKIQIQDAEKFAVILFVDGKLSQSEEKNRCWVFNDSKNNLPVICKIDPGDDKVEGLIKFLSTKEGVGFYEKIIKELEKFLAAV